MWWSVWCADTDVCVCVHACIYTCVRFVYVGGTHMCITAILSPHGALTRGLTLDPGWKGQDSQGGWVGLGLPSYTKAFLLPALEASWFTQLPFIHTRELRPRE